MLEEDCLIFGQAKTDWLKEKNYLITKYFEKPYLLIYFSIIFSRDAQMDSWTVQDFALTSSRITEINIKYWNKSFWRRGEDDFLLS